MKRKRSTHMEKEIKLRTIVIKVGGSTIGAHDTLPRDCALADRWVDFWAEPLYEQL